VHCSALVSPSRMKYVSADVKHGYQLPRKYQGRVGRETAPRSDQSNSCIVSLKYSSMKDRAAVAAGGHF
jgi:hypothetical protein